MRSLVRFFEIWPCRKDGHILWNLTMSHHSELRCYISEILRNMTMPEGWSYSLKSYHEPSNEALALWKSKKSKNSVFETSPTPPEIRENHQKWWKYWQQMIKFRSFCSNNNVTKTANKIYFFVIWAKTYPKMICKILKKHVLFIQIELPTILFSVLDIFKKR